MNGFSGTSGLRVRRAGVSARCGQGSKGDGMDTAGWEIVERGERGPDGERGPILRRVVVGDTVSYTDTRSGEKVTESYTLRAVTKLPGGGSQGKVWVERPCGHTAEDHKALYWCRGTDGRELYPSVFNLEIIRAETPGDMADAA